MGRRHAPDACGAPTLTAFVDTNVLIRYLTGDPPEPAARATTALASGEQLLLADLVLAECVYVLESFYEVERRQVAALMRAALALPTIRVVDVASLLRALEIYELDRIDSPRHTSWRRRRRPASARSCPSIAPSTALRASRDANQ